MTHKEMAAHVRSRLRAAGIKSRCSMKEYCSVRAIEVSPVSLENCDQFTDAQQRELLIIVSANVLTGARGSAIDTEQMTYAWGGTFEFHGGA